MDQEKRIICQNNNMKALVKEETWVKAWKERWSIENESGS